MSSSSLRRLCLLAAAFESDPALQEYAMTNGVLLTTPVTLIALLRTVALGWQQETLAENARAVQKLGAELYDRLRAMTGHLQTLQRSLTASVDAYNKAVGSFESRVLVSARKFPGLGVVGGDGPHIGELSPVDAAPLTVMPTQKVGHSPRRVAFRLRSSTVLARWERRDEVSRLLGVSAD